ncbi:AsnC family transcriptional regulator [Natranaerobius thermophilus]|uniref:siroheme decarboxylase n=1 Tax=Natranaerobius thermophilus (strain ATCC BAA-1301 / DSM 18059 / JW/NM-WN-LF) TaxID=457570 RepID=B2A1H2_NATTJ|nr:AsnC family transcriptional regulator [Natranaerobius thermophilus]ACB84712.1 putative transcriptional regulator, AsnC family [Natranaerobius thermophilus JW/NM-WN-LF]
MTKNQEQLDELDKKILNTIQRGFPIEKRPYKKLAQEVNSNEEEVFQRVQDMRESGFIRRLGGVFDTKKLGFKTTLIALKVDQANIDEVAGRINEYQGVTHNYKREHDFNLWFTLAASGEDELDRQLKEISQLPGVKRMLKLPALKLFKIGVNFKMD